MQKYLEQILELEFVIKNFNNLILRNLLNEGVRLSDFKNIYVNNPFGPKDEKNKTKRKLSKSRKDKKIATLPDSKHLMKRNISNISENTNLHLTNDIKLKAKSEYLNQTLRKMKESLERINQRKQEAKVTTSIDLKPITSNHNHLIPFFSENPTTKSFKYIKKQKKNKEKKTIDLTKLTQKVNESHYKDLNIETKFPIIEKSRILMNSANEKLFDPDLTERTSGLGTHDKKFITRNLSYNQFMMNKKKEESKMIFENKIISLKEIHKKYVNLT